MALIKWCAGYLGKMTALRFSLGYCATLCTKYGTLRQAKSRIINPTRKKAGEQVRTLHL